MNPYGYFFIGMLLASASCWADCPLVKDITYVFKEDDFSIFQTADGWYQPIPTANGTSIFRYAVMYGGPPDPLVKPSKIKRLSSVVVWPDRVRCFYLTEHRSEVILEKKGDAIIKNLEYWHRNSFTEKHYGCDAWGNLDCFFDFQ